MLNIKEMKMPTAILVDGAYFIKRLRNSYGNDIGYDSGQAATIIFECALQHLTKKHKSNKDKQNVGSLNNHQPHSLEEQGLLYRIFFYDCAPLDYKGHNPISKKSIDFSKTDEYLFRIRLHDELKKKRKVALRLGHISKHKSWTLKPDIVEKIIKNNKSEINITENDVELSFQQKGVDMRIGLDIASLTLKKFVRKIVLIAGDADFIPAAKLARREGIDFILDPLGRKVHDDLFEHIDGLQSTLPIIMSRHKSKNSSK